MIKRVFSIFLAALMLAGCLVITSSAARSDLEFSTKGSEGRPDDMVTYEVYCDKNAGTYSACVEVYYDQNAFTLVSCDNGTVWTKSQYTTSPLNSVKDGKGRFRYVAECNNPDEVNESTGLMFTLTFEILKTAVNGDHDITLSFPDNGNGWFFYTVDKKNDIDYVDLSVECTKQSVITVSGSDATAPATEGSTNDDSAPSDSKGNTDKNTDKDSSVTTKAPVYAYVTDDDGKLVKDDEGNYETYEVKDTSKPTPQYVFDDNGEPETDEDGDYVTYYEETSGDANLDSTVKTENDKKDKDGKDTASGTRIIILIVSIAAVVIAAVIIIIVLSSMKKKDPSESADNSGSADSDAPAESPETESTDEADSADETDVSEDKSDDE